MARANARTDRFSAPIAGDPDLERLRALVEGACRAVVFTGAGISTESGIPDFRSPGGIWSRRRPVDFRDFVASEPARREAWSQRAPCSPWTPISPGPSGAVRWGPPPAAVRRGVRAG